MVAGDKGFFVPVACYLVFRVFIVPCEGGGSGASGFIDPCLV